MLAWQLLRAVRRSSGVPTATATPDETPGDEGEADDPARRRTLALVAVGAGGVTAVATGGPVAAFLLAPMFKREPPAWRSLGPIDQFEVGETVLVSFEDPAPLPWSGRAGQSAAWLRRREEQDFEAFSIYCTHLGCAVRWQMGASLFMCPCHGGAFYADGEPASGPVRTPLARHEVRIREGQVEIRTLGLPVTGPITAPE